MLTYKIPPFQKCQDYWLFLIQIINTKQLLIMKMIRLSIMCVGILITSNAICQQLPPPGIPSVAKKSEEKQPQKKPEKSDKLARLSITAGLGSANYLGDLIKGNKAFQQSSFSSSLGLHYAFIPNLAARFDIGYHNVQGYDSKEGGAHPERNLSFRSRIIEFSLTAEFTLMNMNKHKFSPYLFAGIGAFHFNPRAYYGSGGTHGLRELGTEGQGLAGYPGMYSTMAVEYPLGFGFKYAINRKIMLQGEFNFRGTGTDYLDDVSTYYPDKALLDARNPTTSKFTYRGEGPYPKNPTLKRGDASNKDAYYTTQIKIAYRLLQNNKTKKAPKTKAVTLPVKNNEADKDNDGVADTFDKCPDVAGSKENSGCPFPFIDGADLAAVSPDSMTYRIYFDLDRSLLLSEAFKTLQGVVAILKADNTLSVNISGHSDNTGTSAANMKISADRANITRDYLLSYNIPAEKITTAYYGETMPVDDTQQWRNRRVEITLIRK
jgi:outer membrane protein OmpA-like peptidoglycan-associated protein